MEMNNFIDVGDFIYNDFISVLQKQLDENETRKAFGQPPLPYVISVKDFLGGGCEKAREVHANVKHYGRDPHGTADEWADRAIERFRDNLLRMVHTPEGDSALKDCLQSQIFELWPELIPPRSLSTEEVAELCELQAQADTIIDNLKQSTTVAIEGLWAIATAELGIISGTSDSNKCLINGRVRCELAALAGIISTSWDRQTGNLVEPAEQIKKYFMHAAPCRWADKQKQRDETRKS